MSEPKIIIATIEIVGVENWSEFQNPFDTIKTEAELRELEADIQDELSTILGRREDISVRCNLIF